MAKIDLAAAYRSVQIHPSCHRLTGLQWLFKGRSLTTYMSDVKLPFGAAMSCSIFQRLTDSICRMMKRRGFTVVGYLDDFLVIERTKEQCMVAYNCLSNLLIELGFTINWGKACPPCQKLTYLGISIDSCYRALSLPEEKLMALSLEVDKWLQLKRAKKVELQQLVGRLNWAARVIRGGRCFLRRLIDLSSKGNHPNWHTSISKDARADILWWKEGLALFNGTTVFPNDVPLPAFAFATDSSSVGGGGHYGNDWYYVNWEVDMPEVQNKHITFLELQSVVLAVKRWGQLWAGLHIRVVSDNKATVSAVNKGTSKSKDLMLLVRELFWLCVIFDCSVTASYI